MNKNRINDDVISTREAADLLGVAMRTVQLWVEAGVLPAWKTAGGHRRIARAAVDRLRSERQAAIHTAAPAPSKPLSVLVVEDEPALLRLFTLVIGGWELPLELHTASNGFEALIRMGERHPDLLITDLNMPGMDGFRMIRFLHGLRSPTCPPEIVVVTALSTEEIADRGGLPAEIQVFTKPVPFSTLEKLVRQKLAARAPAEA